MTATVTVTAGLATITLDRPKAHNALDAATKVALLDAVTEVSGDSEVRAVLLAATGKNFCVGQDLGEHVAALEADPSTAMSTVVDHYNPLIRVLAAIDVPVVVAIGGACVGAGLGIALAGDIRVAGRSASFATAFTGVGLASDSGLSHSLVAALGPSRAMGLMLLGDKVAAEQAADWGLVHRVVDDEAVYDEALKVATRLAQGPTVAYRQVKRLLGASGDGLSVALDREAVAQALLGATTDHRAAVDAFLAKRRPVFSGR